MPDFVDRENSIVKMSREEGRRGGGHGFPGGRGRRMDPYGQPPRHDPRQREFGREGGHRPQRVGGRGFTPGSFPLPPALQSALDKEKVFCNAWTLRFTQPVQAWGYPLKISESTLGADVEAVSKTH